MVFRAAQFYEHMVINRWIGLLFVTLFAVFSLYKLWFAQTSTSPSSSRNGDKENNKPMLSIRILFTIYISCNLSSFIFSLVAFQILRDYYDELWLISSEFRALASIAVFLHVFSLCLHYVIMLVWLYTTFNNTSFSINKYHLIIPYGISLCIMSIGIILYSYYKAQTTLWERKSSYFFPNFLIMTVVINSIVGISIIYLFVSRLRKIMVRSGEKAGNGNEKLMHLMTKLTCLGVISTVFVSIDAMTICVYQLIVEEDRSWVAGIILWYSQVFTVWTEIICLFLTFNINKGLYDKLCYACHRLFTIRTIRKVQKEKVKAKQLEVQMSSQESLDIQEIQSGDDQYTPNTN